MSADIAHLPIPQFHRSIDAVLRSATSLVERQRIENIIVLGETPDGDLMFLSAGKAEQITYAEALWLLERAKHLMLHPENFSRLNE